MTFSEDGIKMKMPSENFPPLQFRNAVVSDCNFAIYNMYFVSIDSIHETNSIYRTRAIITRGLYFFNPIFEAQKRFFKELFS